MDVTDERQFYPPASKFSVVLKIDVFMSRFVTYCPEIAAVTHMKTRANNLTSEISCVRET